MMVKVNIDGKEIEVEKGTYIIKIAEKLGINIPTLCYHPSLQPYGACRLCIVEVEKNGRKKIVTSCNYPVEDGLIVKTDTEEIKNLRKLLIELLISRCPGIEKLEKLAEEYGVRERRFEEGKENCILCGLCVRVCSEIIGANAISFTGRGIEREVSTPFKISSESCIGCGACVYICPTGAIKMEDIDGKTRIEKWNTELELKKCKICGKPVAPVRQIEYIKSKIKLPEDLFELCQECKRKYYGKKIIALGGNKWKIKI